MPDSLYIHIPFCIQKCLYCDFFSVPYNESFVKAYTNALCKELYLKKGSAHKLKTIYIGGGTPSLLPDECFVQIFQCLRDNFNLSTPVEITVEANPGTLRERGIHTMLSLGVNRISIGVQSMNNVELKTLGRIHTEEDALGALELVKKAGITNFSIDLMYGIPGQTIGSWHDTITKALERSPSHISTYELTLEENTPLFELVKSRQLILPDEELILEMYYHAIDHLTRCGYEHYEISNFALPGFRCVHNLNYWDRGEYIGAGAEAHSFIAGTRLRNMKEIAGYIGRLNKGIIPETESMGITRAEALKEFIFLGLRKTEGISIEIAEKKGLDIPALCGELLDDHLEVKDNTLRLTRKGMVVSNAVIVKLFEKLGL